MGRTIGLDALDSSWPRQDRCDSVENDGSDQDRAERQTRGSVTERLRFSGRVETCCQENEGADDERGAAVLADLSRCKHWSGRIPLPSSAKYVWLPRKQSSEITGCWCGAPRSSRSSATSDVARRLAAALGREGGETVLQQAKLARAAVVQLDTAPLGIPPIHRPPASGLYAMRSEEPTLGTSFANERPEQDFSGPDHW